MGVDETNMYKEETKCEFDGTRMNRKFKVKMTLEKTLVDRRVRIARA
jgi:hypothetical protein